MHVIVKSEGIGADEVTVYGPYVTREKALAACPPDDPDGDFSYSVEELQTL